MDGVQKQVLIEVARRQRSAGHGDFRVIGRYHFLLQAPDIPKTGEGHHQQGGGVSGDLTKQCVAGFMNFHFLDRRLTIQEMTVGVTDSQQVVTWIAVTQRHSREPAIGNVKFALTLVERNRGRPLTVQ